MLRRSLTILTVLLPLVAFTGSGRRATAAEPVPAESSPAAPAYAYPVITAIGVVKGKSGTLVTISGNTDLKYDYFVIDGRSLVIDVPGATSSVWPAEQQVNDDFVSRVRVAQQSGDRPGVRVVFDLKRPDAFTVRGDTGQIAVWFAAGKAAAAPPEIPAAAASEAQPPAQTAPATPTVAPPPAPAALTRVTDVTATRLPNAFRVAVKTDAKPVYRVLESGDPQRVAIAIDAAALGPDSQKATDYSDLGTPITRISVWSEQHEPPVAMIAIDLRQPLPFRVFTDAYGLNVDFNSDVRRAAEPVSPAPSLLTPTPEPVESATRGSSPRDSERLTKAFTGKKITLDFLDADITDIFRLIAEVSGMNIVASEDIKNKRSVKMTEIPWDQALDLILKTNNPQLVQVPETGNVVRITTLNSVLVEEAAAEKRRLEQIKNQRNMDEDMKKSIEAQQNLEPLVLKSYAISYGKAGDIKNFLEKSLISERGKNLIQYDDRTNLLVVQDIAARIPEIDRVVQALDTPTPAVLVEARIVEVSSGYEQQLGVQWNMAGVADAAHGNATDFAFPNSMSVGGTQSTDTGSYLVNLPAASATSGIGFTFGHIANTLSLDMRLSAMEQLGQTKILSNPKVLVIQNQKAEINVGSQLPVTKTSSEGDRTVEWKNVGIVLEVKPQVTKDNRVFLEILVEKSSQGENVDTTDGTMFSINTSRAKTQVLIADGETTVIGGLFVQETIKDESSVPGLSKLPLVGWLFKNKSDTQRKSELMIFLTPRLVAQ